MSVRKVSYCYVTVPNRPGEGAKVIGELKKAKVKLVACSGFPTISGSSQLDLVSENMGTVRRVAKKNGWKLSPTKKGFLIRGDDRMKAIHRQIRKLADEKINVTAAEGVCTRKGRFGMMLWVKDKDFGRATRALKAK